MPSEETIIIGLCVLLAALAVALVLGLFSFVSFVLHNIVPILLVAAFGYFVVKKYVLKK
jgi:hypothetical protein